MMQGNNKTRGETSSSSSLSSDEAAASGEPGKAVREASAGVLACPHISPRENEVVDGVFPFSPSPSSSFWLLVLRTTSLSFLSFFLVALPYGSAARPPLLVDCTGESDQAHFPSPDHHHQEHLLIHHHHRLIQSTLRKRRSPNTDYTDYNKPPDQTQADSANSNFSPLNQNEHHVSGNTITMAGWNGKFELESSENFDEFLKALGVGFILRNAAKMSTPTIEITNEGDAFTLKTVTTFKTSEIKFTLGQEFDETRMDGVTVKTTVTKEGDNKLVQSQAGEPACTIIRELIEDGAKLKTVCKTGDVVSTRVYKRL